MHRRLPAARRPLVLLSAGVTALVLLAGCTPSPAPTITDPPSPTAETTAPTESPAPAPVLVADGSATDNLPYFASVVQQTASAGGGAAGRAYVDALVAAGFDRAAMQVTPDETTIGNPAESVEFSVRWRDGCLVGQVGPVIGEPVTTVLPGLAEGRCLVGVTRTIDW